MEAFAKAFPELQNDEALSVLKEDDMKSKVGKERWRNFMMPFEKHIDDYNFGTLIRSNCAEDYTEANSIFGVSSLLLWGFRHIASTLTNPPAPLQATAPSSTPSRSHGTAVASTTLHGSRLSRPPRRSRCGMCI